MKIKSFTFNIFEENTFIVYDQTKKCIIIDPGCYTKEEQQTLKDFINKEKLKPIKLINTHCHIDHILGNKFVCDEWNIDLFIHKKDLPLLENSKKISQKYGFENYIESPYPNFFLSEGDKLSFGNSYFEIIFAPGHAPGHICLYSKENSTLFGGDVLFNLSIGRTDLPGGDYETLIKSITHKILILPDQTQIFCGHGPSTSIEYEKKYNPFLIK